MIDSEKANYKVSDMCRWAGVSESGFYDWLSRPCSKTQLFREKVADLVKTEFKSAHCRYGSRNLVVKLKDAHNVVCSEFMVRSVMREHSLRSVHSPAKCNLTKRDAETVFDDLLKRDFSSEIQGVKLVGDMTEINTWEGKIYLSTVIDLWNRELIGYSFGDHHDAQLVQRALEMAYVNNEISVDALFHSDHGSEYTSKLFKNYCKQIGIKQSMGRVGSCYDNAVAESFFATLKKELIYTTVFPTKKQAEKAIRAYIETWYNTVRQHSTNGYKTPKQMKQEHKEQQQAA